MRGRKDTIIGRAKMRDDLEIVLNFSDKFRRRASFKIGVINFNKVLNYDYYVIIHIFSSFFFIDYKRVG